MKHYLHTFLTTLCFTILISSSLYITNYVFAATATKSATIKATATPSPSPTGSPTDQANQEIKKRIEKITETGQVNGVMSTKLSEKTGFVGEVSRLSQESLTIRQGSDTTIIPFTDTLALFSKDKKISPDDIEVGNWAIVLGSKTNDKMNPEYVLVSKTSLQPKAKFVGIGTITNISKGKITVLPRGATTEQALTITKTSKFQNDDNTDLKATDFQKDLSVVVTGFRNDDGTFSLLTVHALTDVKASK